jgi:hypothetical protein
VRPDTPPPPGPPQAARKKLKSFAGQAVKDLQQNDRKAAAIQLKKMVQFNS